MTPELSDAIFYVARANDAAKIRLRPGAVPNCNHGNACPWTEQEDCNGKTHCRACGLVSQGSCQG